MGERTATDIEELKNRFTYHAPEVGQREKYENLRESGRKMATLIFLLCPDSRERSLAITKIEEAVMWANGAIARRKQ